MQFGNWKIENNTIKWNGEGAEQFEIKISQMLETKTVPPFNQVLYTWIIQATDEDWLTDDDLYDLNFAFAYAAGTSGQAFDYATFDRTLEHQFDTLDHQDNCES